MKETVCSVDLTIKHISQCTLFKSKQCTEVLFFLLRIFLQRKLFFQSTSFERSDSYLFGTEDQDLSKKIKVTHALSNLLTLLHKKAKTALNADAIFEFCPPECRSQCPKISNSITKTYIGLTSMLQGFQKCIA